MSGKQAEKNNKKGKIKRVFSKLYKALKKFVKGTIKLSIKTLTFFMLFMVFLAALCWVMFIKYFNAQDVSQLIADQMQGALARPVVIGSLELQFFNSAKIKKMLILDTEIPNAPPLLEAEEVSLKYNIWDIFKKEIHIEEVTLKNPKIIISKNEDGSLNMPVIDVSSARQIVSKTPGTNKEESFKVRIDDWKIVNGTFMLRDDFKNTVHALYDVNMEFRNLDFNASSNFKTGFLMRNVWQDKMIEVAVKAGGSVNFSNFDWSKFNLRNTNVELAFFDKPIKIRLDVDNVYTPFLSFTADIPALTDADLSLFLNKPLNINFPQMKISANTVLKRSYHHFSVNKLQLISGDIKADASGNLYLDRLEGDFNVKTDFFKMEGKEAIYAGLKKFNLKGNGAVNLKGVFKDKKVTFPEAEVSVKNAAAKIGNYNGGWNISEATGVIYAKDEFKTLGTKVSTGTLKIGRQVFSEVKGDCEYSSKANKLTGLVSSAKLNGVPMKVGTTISNFRHKTRRKVDANLYMQNFDIVGFYDTIFDFVITIVGPVKSKNTDNGNMAWLRVIKNGLPAFMPNLNGFIVADTFTSPVLSGNNFYTEFNLTGLIPPGSKLSGTLDAQLSNGVIYQLERKAEEEKVLGVAFQPFIVMHRMEKAGTFRVGRVLKDVSYNKISLSTDFKNGTMDIVNFFSDGPTLAFAATGEVNWLAERLNATIWTIFKNTSRSGALAENLTDASGAPALAFRVHDSMSSPKVEMLKPRTSGAEIRKAINKGIRTDFSAAEKFRPKK